MNRITAQGLALEAITQNKRIVAVVSRHEILSLIRDLTSSAFGPEVVRICRANGDQVVDYIGGGSVTIRSQMQSIRGLSPNLVYVDAGQWGERMREAIDPLLAMGAEVIRA